MLAGSPHKVMRLEIFLSHGRQQQCGEKQSSSSHSKQPAGWLLQAGKGPSQAQLNEEHMQVQVLCAGCLAPRATAG